MPDWTEAACAQVGGEPFFPDDYTVTHQLRLARQICLGCPIRTACLQVAMDAERGRSASMRFGLYGGLSPAQRHRLEREAVRGVDSASSVRGTAA